VLGTTAISAISRGARGLEARRRFALPPGAQIGSASPPSGWLAPFLAAMAATSLKHSQELREWWLASVVERDHQAAFAATASIERLAARLAHFQTLFSGDLASSWAFPPGSCGPP